MDFNVIHSYYIIINQTLTTRLNPDQPPVQCCGAVSVVGSCHHIGQCHSSCLCSRPSLSVSQTADNLNYISHIVSDTLKGYYLTVTAVVSCYSTHPSWYPTTSHWKILGLVHCNLHFTGLETKGKNGSCHVASLWQASSPNVMKVSILPPAPVLPCPSPGGLK